MAQVLSTKRKQILDCISEAVRDRGYPPSVREIGEAVGLTSSSTVHAHLAVLQREGYLRRDPTKPRAIDLAQELRPPRPLPLVGRVAAGQPILAEENVEDYVDVPAFLRRDDGDFVLRVRGDSMIGAGPQRLTSRLRTSGTRAPRPAASSGSRGIARVPRRPTR